jgi:hypothetical protein
MEIFSEQLKVLIKWAGEGKKREKFPFSLNEMPHIVESARQYYAACKDTPHEPKGTEAYLTAMRIRAVLWAERPAQELDRHIHQVRSGIAKARVREGNTSKYLEMLLEERAKKAPNLPGDL